MLDGQTKVPCLLVVDPDEQVHNLVRLMAKGQGIRICSAYRGHEALQWVLYENFDAMLFGMFGPQGIRKQDWDCLAGQKVPDIIPTILCSRLSQEEGNELARSLKARRFLRKPFHKKALLTVLRECMGGSFPKG